MSNDVDEAGDYSYDLAQEARTAIIPAQRRRVSLESLRGIPFDLDYDSDYGYDQAHQG
ncbi:hypothetical protein SAMN05443637_104178 [Pseudonocardia thermophila]|jgi:hypothetical protein|uniref:Uncharacterized protein n=1 Tax=Pseudonocardia thermophila TaxID=1848 RepID=A0A1M6R4I8_PSETH|nr:hypothetical protein [Pseudonocardia thermophila]SHK27353.1 hypothetical protein SAMN05443637_104178 [Pseudonocardia thermophila]